MIFLFTFKCKVYGSVQRMILRAMKACVKPIVVFVMSTMLSSIIHWSLMQFLCAYCTDNTWIGLAKHVFYLGSPVCMFVNTVQLEIAKYYVKLWTISAIATVAWIASRFAKMNA